MFLKDIWNRPRWERVLLLAFLTKYFLFLENVLFCYLLAAIDFLHCHALIVNVFSEFKAFHFYIFYVNYTIVELNYGKVEK